MRGDLDWLRLYIKSDFLSSSCKKTMDDFADTTIRKRARQKGAGWIELEIRPAR
jgi:hypothetical protein